VVPPELLGWEFQRQLSDIRVGVFFCWGTPFWPEEERVWVATSDCYWDIDGEYEYILTPPTPTEIMEAGFLLRENLIIQVQEFIDILQAEGIIES